MDIDINVWAGDCLILMKYIPDNSVDLILADPPYGTTKCKWDSIIPLDQLWKQLKRVIKPSGAIIMTSCQPFTTTLISSNIKMFKYEWIWHKSKCGSAFTSKYRPQQKHENILVFGDGTLQYYPIMTKGKPYYRKRKANDGSKPNNHKLGVISESETINLGTRYPGTVQYFQQKWRRQDQCHPTQKPVSLMQYMIETYSNTDEIILDFSAGSFTTALACINTDRKFIGIELDPQYIEIGIKRITELLSVMHKKRTIYINNMEN